MDWARSVFDEETIGSAEKPDNQSSGINWARETFEPTEIRAEKEPRKSKFRFGEQQEPASWSTHAKAAWVDDPEAKIKIYAKDRGISPDRYMIKRGKIYYLGDDGLFYPETPPKATAITAGLAARPLSMAGGIAGATIGGPFLAGLLGAGGRGIEKTIGHLAFDEPQKPLENLTDIGKEFLIGATGELAGRGLVRGIDITRGREGAKLIRAAGRGRERISLAEVKEIRNLAKKYNIKLVTPQLTGSRELAARWNLLADLMETADKIGKVSLKQYNETAAAIDNFINSFALPTTTPMQAGRKGVEAAKKGIEAAKLIRKNRAAPFYEKAFTSGIKVDTTDVIQKIDDLLEKTVKGDPSFASLNRIKKMINEAEGDLEKLHRVKYRGIDAILDKAKADNTLRREMKEIKDDLLESMNAASEDYTKANEIFAEWSTPIKELTDSKVGEIAKIQGDAVEKVAFKLFSPTQSSPEIIEKVKPIIIKYGGEDVWNELLRVHLSNALDSIRESVTGGITNLGGRFRQATFGYPKQRKIFEAAMTPKQFKNLENFSKVLDRLGIILSKESRTTPIGKELAKMQKEAGGGILMPIRVVAHPLVSPARPWYEMLRDMRFSYRANKLADLMISDKASKQLEKILLLKPKSIKFIKAATALLSQIGGRIYLAEPDETTEYIPEYLSEAYGE
jgi:hypothetical protein